MSSHDLIDNRQEKLVDHIRRMLHAAQAGRFAVGYFFLSGFEAIADRLAGVKELRLLIGNTTNRETVEQLAEGYRRLELVAEAVEQQAYRRRGEARQMARGTADDVAASLEVMDQTDAAAAAVQTLVRMIEEKRLKVRIYTKGRMHAKAYIFDYPPAGGLFGGTEHSQEKPGEDKGIAVVGSSNLSLPGVSHPTELNVIVRGNENHAALVAWFDELWGEAEEFDEALVHEMRQSWALAQVTPYELYLRTLYRLVKDRLEGEESAEVIVNTKIEQDLADFQKRAVDVVSLRIRDYGGAFVADVVGLGKSFIGAAIAKRQEQAGARPLIICPAPLVDMWERYDEVYQLNARVLSMGMLSDEGRVRQYLDPQRGEYRERDFVLIDESHNFRTAGTVRYEALQRFMEGGGRRCCLLTATPRNKSAWDVYHQIKLFHPDDKTFLPVDPPDLKQYFRQVENGAKKLQDLLTHVLYRRRRNDILKYYGYDEQTHEKVNPARFRDYLDGKKRAYVLVGGRHQFFPTRQLETVEYSIEETYQGLYQKLRGFLGKDRRAQTAAPPAGELTYARYGLWHYVLPHMQKKEPYQSLHQAGSSLRGLVRVMMFKRFESSVYAFQQTVRRMLNVHRGFLKALEEGIVPAGEEAQSLLYESGGPDDPDLMDALRAVTGRYDVADFDSGLLRDHIAHDIVLLEKIGRLVDPITPAKDAKLRRLRELLESPPLATGKRLLFTQYADTARYLYDNLNPGGRCDDVEVVHSGDKNKLRVVGRFAPRANPALADRARGEPPLNTVVATDVFSEGLNLQDCDKIVNYDLHWNPVRLIQRFGRIDRIGSDYGTIYGYNFLPEAGIEQNLGLKQTLAARINEIHETIGEDSKILDQSEKLNENAMYAIYEGDASQLGLFEEEEDDLVNLNDAEELLRQLRADNPALYNRIATMRDGVRAARAGTDKGTFVFCEAAYAAESNLKGYQQLFLVDSGGGVVTRDVPRILGALQCAPDEPGAPLPAGHNEAVMRVRRQFAEEVKHREAELQHTLSLTQGQRYVLRELRVLFAATGDEDARAQINLVERAFRGPVTTSINRELNGLRRAGTIGPALLEALKLIYQQHNMRRWLDQRGHAGDQAVPRVVCSEGLV